MLGDPRSKTGRPVPGGSCMPSSKGWLLLWCLAALVWMGNAFSPAGGESGALALGPRGTSWAAGSWSYRIPITVKPDSISGTGSLVDFSVLLRLGPQQASVFSGANAN